MVLKKLKKSFKKNNKSAGSDGIHPCILKETPEAIFSLLAMMFNKSMQEHHVPERWKEAHVIALHKKESKSKPYAN